MVVGQFGLPRGINSSERRACAVEITKAELCMSEKNFRRTGTTIVAATSEGTNRMFVSAAICPL